MQDWIAADCECILALTFDKFIMEFRDTYLPKDWKALTCMELLSMTQGGDSFWDFSIKVQAKNSLLVNTTSHLNKE
jgi:hypothetical protein